MLNCYNKYHLIMFTIYYGVIDSEFTFDTAAFFNQINNKQRIKPNPTVITEIIDEFVIEHHFDFKEDAKEFANILIKVPPVCNKYVITMKSKTNSKTITLYDGEPNNVTEDKINNQLSVRN